MGYYALGGSGTGLAQAAEPSSARGRQAWAGVGCGGSHGIRESRVRGYNRIPSRMWPGEQNCLLFLWQVESLLPPAACEQL